MKHNEQAQRKGLHQLINEFVLEPTRRVRSISLYKYIIERNVLQSQQSGKGCLMNLSLNQESRDLEFKSDKYLIKFY